MNDEAWIEPYTVDGNILVIKLRGSLEAADSEAFKQAVEQHLAAGHKRVIIDCSRLGFLSSFGIGALVSLQSKVTKQGGDVKLATLQGPVADLLRLVRLDKLFDAHRDIEYARQSFIEEGKKK